ncbi:MAG: HU family DNA-binding protein [Armatimonadota bacterium]
MTKADLIDAVTEHTELRKKDVATVVEAAFTIMASSLARHEKVQIVGFGSFEPRRRKGRVGRDPRNQKEIKIPPSWSLGFKVGRQLKEAVTGKSRRRGR